MKVKKNFKVYCDSPIDNRDILTIRNRLVNSTTNWMYSGRIEEKHLGTNQCCDMIVIYMDQYVPEYRIDDYRRILSDTSGCSVRYIVRS